MATQAPDVEILVHVNAPSRTADDITYRQLAQAYLAFQPAPRQSGSAVQRLSEESMESDQCMVIDSQDLSFQSALDNRSSPVLAARRQDGADEDVIPSSHPQEGPASQSSWRAPPSQISDSYPMPNAAIYVSPTRVLQRFMKRPLALSPSSSPSSPSVRPDVDISTDSPVPIDVNIPSSFPEPCKESGHHHRVGDANGGNTAPLTPVTTEREPLGDSGGGPDDVDWDVTHISVSDLSVHPPDTTSSEYEHTRPAKRIRANEDVEIAPGSSAAACARSSDPTRAACPSSTPDPNTKPNVLEVRPSSPPIGVDAIGPNDLVPDKLAKLAQQLSSRYRPKTTRDIQPFERGFWFLDCSEWTEEKHTETWAFLASYVGSGLAGWGVWCQRDEARSWIRLYCWGHLVKHTYLLLYLASGRYLKQTGGEWRDADGQVPLRVLPHEK